MALKKDQLSTGLAEIRAGGRLALLKVAQPAGGMKPAHWQPDPVLGRRLYFHQQAAGRQRRV